MSGPNLIALTGHPVAQEAAHLQLQALIAQRQAPVRVLAGLTKAEEACAVIAEGGEVWQCGTDPAREELEALVDRTLPANTFDAMALHVAGAFAAAMAGTAQEASHG